MKRCDNVFMTFVFILLAVFLAKNLHAEVEVSKPYKEEVIQKSVVSGNGHGQIQDKSEIIQKVQKLQAPFTANDGQTDERVKFYANTFGGTVFVTRDGEIVYSLPAGRGEEEGGRKQGCIGAEGQGGKVGKQDADGWHGQALLVRDGGTQEQSPLVHAESEFLKANIKPVVARDVVPKQSQESLPETQNPQSKI